MIAYSCPKCRAFLTAHEVDAGKKLGCPSCGQRLQVPAPPPANRTVLGKLEDLDPPPRPEAVTPAHALGSRPASVRQAASPSVAGLVSVACPGCGRSIQLQPGELSLTVQCAGCNHRFIPVPSSTPIPTVEPVVERVESDDSRRRGPRCPYC